MPSSKLKTRLKSLKSQANQLTSGGSRFVDYGIRLWVVRQDLDRGVQVIPGLPPLVRVGDPIDIGGRFDRLSGRFIGEPEERKLWLVGERHFQILRESLNGFECTPSGAEPSRRLLLAAEGAGKTVLMSQWLTLKAIFLAMSGLIGFGGATAPTVARLQTLINSMGDRFIVDTPDKPHPSSWATWFTTDKELRFHCGTKIQFRSTKKQSEELGSALQSMNWHFCGSDEIQDSVASGADPDIEARLRAARYSERMATATAKDSANYRTWRDQKDASPDWAIERLDYRSTPFVWMEHWERMLRNISEREAKRRVFALDVAPEHATYPTFSRDRHVRPLPQIARDVTEYVCEPFGSFQRPGARFRLIGLHDPGALENTTVFVRAYLVPKTRTREAHVLWYVVGEFITTATTQRAHACQLKEYVREEFDLNLEPDRFDEDAGNDRVLVLNDPHSRGEKQPDEDEYQSFITEGFDIFPATGGGKQVIKQRTRIESVNRLLERNWLLFAARPMEPGVPVALRTVESFEVMEREEGTGKTESTKKGKKDKSHPSVAVGYGMFAFEREQMTEFTLRRALEGAIS